MAYDRDKFKTLVHYICWKVQNPLELGATKLNKVLWYSDLLAYLNLGESITGARYVKRQFGPAPVAVLPILDELKSEGALAIRETEYKGKPKREFFALRAPGIEGVFNADTVRLVDSVVEAVCRRNTAASISKFSHDDAWMMAEIGEDLPFYTAFSARQGELDEDDLAWADARIAEATA